MAKARIRKIVVNNLAEVGAFLRHGPGATLAESHAVPLLSCIVKLLLGTAFHPRRLPKASRPAS